MRNFISYRAIVLSVPYCLTLKPKMANSLRCIECLKSCDNFFNTCNMCNRLNVVLAKWLFHTKMHSDCFANLQLFNQTKTVIATQKKSEMFLKNFLLTDVKMIYHILTSFIKANILTSAR